MSDDFDLAHDKLPDQPVTIGGDKSAAAWHGAERDALEAKEMQWREASRLLRERTGQLSLVEAERDALQRGVVAATERAEAAEAERDALAAQRSQMRALVIDALANADDTHMGWDAEVSATALLDILDTAPAVSLALHDAEVKSQGVEEARQSIHDWAGLHAAPEGAFAARVLEKRLTGLVATIRAEAK